MDDQLELCRKRLEDARRKRLEAEAEEYDAEKAYGVQWEAVVREVANAQTVSEGK